MKPDLTSFLCMERWWSLPKRTRIRVSEAATVADSLIATGFPYTNFSQMNEFIESLNYCTKTVTA